MWPSVWEKKEFKKMHLPVLKEEAISFLDSKPGESFIDSTFGQGGHALEILKKIGPKGKILGIDRDSELLENTLVKDERLTLAQGSFEDLKSIAESRGFGKVSGILMDLGFCTWHLEESGRGFSFLKDEPLDMRYDRKENLNAWKIVNEWEAGEIERILRDYGEERFAARISEKIAEERKAREIKSTFELVKIIGRAVPCWYCKRKINCATKTFQALRIAVNRELEILEKALPQAVDLLEEGGRIVVISFHSLEDRIVKRFFISESKKEMPLIKILTKKPVAPNRKEIESNPKARSAKLRAAMKIS
jgi:16S rRNA (cytosine1402-N4)-methyltransferase